MPAPDVTVVLPTLNGAAHLRRLLPLLAAQVTLEGDPLPLEICAIDSDSTDCTRELLDEHGAHVDRIPRQEFGHGRSRNLAARRARGEFLVFLSQDTEPADESFVARLLAAFRDPRVAGASSRILPRPGDDPLSARTVLDLPESSEEPWVRDLDWVDGVWKLDPETRAAYLRFNNVASAIRASVFREIPFPDVQFGEDFAWAARALTAGHRIAFVPDSVAYHAHEYSMREALDRYRIDALFHYSAHGYRVRPTLRSAVRGFLYEVWKDLRFLRGTPSGSRARLALRSPGLRMAQVVGQYLGSHGWHPSSRNGDGQPPVGTLNGGLHL